MHMDYVNMIDRIKVLLGMKEQETEYNFENMKLDDGVTILQADKFEAGENVSIVNESGLVPLPIGDYNLEDGRILSVTEEGVIAEIKDAVVTEETQMADPVSPPEDSEGVIDTPPIETVPPVGKPQFVTMEEFQRFAEEVMGILDELTSSMNMSKETILSKEKEIEDLKVELSNVPAATKISHNPETKVEDYKPKNRLETIYKMIEK